MRKVCRDRVDGRWGIRRIGAGAAAYAADARKGDDQTGAFLPAGVESADQATERVRSYKPDPVKYPVAAHALGWKT